MVTFKKGDLVSPVKAKIFAWKDWRRSKEMHRFYERSAAPLLVLDYCPDDYDLGTTDAVQVLAPEGYIFWGRCDQFMLVHRA